MCASNGEWINAETKNTCSASHHRKTAQEKIFFIWCRFKFRHTSAPYYFYRNDSSLPPLLHSAMLAIVNRLQLSMTNIQRRRFLSLLSLIWFENEHVCDFYRLQIYDREAQNIAWALPANVQWNFVKIASFAKLFNSQIQRIIRTFSQLSSKMIHFCGSWPQPLHLQWAPSVSNIIICLLHSAPEMKTEIFFHLFHFCQMFACTQQQTFTRKKHSAKVWCQPW